METTLGEIQTIEHALVIVMENIQNHLMKGNDPNETSSVEEMPAISESIPPHAGPSGEQWNPLYSLGHPFKLTWKSTYDELKRYSLQRSPRGQNPFL